MGLLRAIAGGIGLLVLFAVGKWFKHLRMRVIEIEMVCDLVTRGGGLRDDVVELKAGRKVLIAALEKENVIKIGKVDASSGKTEFNATSTDGPIVQGQDVTTGEVGAQPLTGRVKDDE